MTEGLQQKAVQDDQVIANGQSRELLGECVKQAVNGYFQQMDGHDISGLYRFVLDEIEKPLLESVMTHVRGNQSKAANVLSMSRSTLRKKLAKYALD